ncbi:NUDIX domain-containing protein [Maribacter sp. 2307ULW6-5]|uniref:NUDIX domain-containing protein n=1 Tax=Maribacter sp. 2307ULW6-5 TaxID=3386275 RepID=UPI0039BC4C2E
MKQAEIRNVKEEVLSDGWYTLKKYTFDYLREDRSWENQQRESYDCGDGAAILLYHKERKTVVMTRQFRMPTYVNDNKEGMMVEVCAGLLDGLSPEECIKKEALEETGYEIREVSEVMSAYMCPGSVTQKLHLFVGEYRDEMKVSEGGGAVDETENIEVLELPFKEALSMAHNGAIRDAKSIMLLQYAAMQGLL